MHAGPPEGNSPSAGPGRAKESTRVKEPPGSKEQGAPAQRSTFTTQYYSKRHWTKNGPREKENFYTANSPIFRRRASSAEHSHRLAQRSLNVEERLSRKMRENGDKNEEEKPEIKRGLEWQVGSGVKDREVEEKLK